MSGEICYVIGACDPPAPDPAEAPARVQVAMELLRRFTAKTRSRTFATDAHGLLEADGDKLTREEWELQEQCCKYLASYLRGEG